MGWMKFNVDGSAKGKSGIATASGLARDDNGQWLLGFRQSTGWATGLKTVVWIILKVVDIAASQGFTMVIIESNSVESLNLVRHGSEDHPLYNLAEAIRESSWAMEECKFQHVRGKQIRVRT